MSFKDSFKHSLCIIRYDFTHTKGYNLSDVTLVLLGAGTSSRFTQSASPHRRMMKKQWLFSGEQPLWLQVATHFETLHPFPEILIVSSAEDLKLMPHFGAYRFIEGGDSRQASLRNALAVVKTPYVLVSDIARACVPETMLTRLLDAKEQAACVVPVLPATDTLYQAGTPLDREQVRIVQTPQLSHTATLKRALESQTLFTDDSSAIASLGEPIAFVEGDPRAHKLTTIADLAKLPCLRPPSRRPLTGFGIDIHPFEQGKTMVLCGVPIEAPMGFKAHSDGDVAIHALIDALLGGAGMGDIGEHFPDTDATYAGADSTKLLQVTVERLYNHGYEIGNVDMTILAQTPKISPYKQQMRHTLARLLQLPMHRVNIKATTAEKLGFVGRKEGVTVHAVATLYPIDWTTLLSEERP